MFGFPIGNGNAGFNDFVEKFTNNADSGFPKIQQREVFYSVKDGNWNDITIWQTASGRVGKFPTANDDVYIRHFINVNSSFTNGSFVCNNLYVSGYLNTDLGTSYAALYVFGNIKIYGTLNLGPSNLTVNPFYIYIYGNDNIIQNVILGNTYIYYSGNNQPILPITYNYLGIGVSNYLIGNIIVNNAISLTTGATFDFRNFDVTCFGNLSSGNFCSIIKTGNTNNSSFNSIVLGSFNNFDFSFSNSNLEIKNGFSIGGNSTLRTGTGTWTFSTNNQNINIGASTFAFWDCLTIISGAINVTNISSVGLSLSNTINGNNALSKLINNATIIFNTQNAAENSMTTGVIDFTTTANTIQYGGNYSATIPSYFTNFHNLTISGTGTKTLSANTTLNGNLSISSGGILECSLYNLFITGTTSMSGTGTNTLSKNSSGNITFVGSLNQSGGPGVTNLLSFTGNPDIEFRNGLNFASSSTTSGTGTWTFSTNNQSLNFNILGTTINGNILVSGAITVIYASPSVLSLYGTLNGNNASSVWDNRSTLNLYNSTLPMSTGTFIQDVTATSTIGYMFNGSYNLPYTSYQGLLLSGTGTKTLNGNTTIKANLNVTGSVGNVSVLECSTSNLTINGITSINAYGTLSKTGAGALRFDGNFGNIANSSLSLTGNPTLEFRGGIISHNNSGNYGSGAVTLSTNNQTINFPSSATFDGNITISGAITITISNTGLISNGSINGNNASSTLRMAASSTLTYRNATQPMATGILDTSTNLNTWIYGNLNQDIKGSPTISPKQVYRNLTLNGLGVKTLQGYVSVLNTYTLTAPATLVNNGFTLTNP